MPDFIQLKCTNCGGDLVQNPQDNSYSCKMCSAKYMLKFEHGGIQIERILDAKLQGVQAGVNVLASEMAIQRLRQEIRLQTQEINTIKSALNAQESQFRNMVEIANSSKKDLELEKDGGKGKIPVEPKYNAIRPFIICFSFLLLFLFGS